MKSLLFCFFCIPIALAAQINDSDTLNLKAKLSLTGFWQSGNVETVIFRAQSDVSVKLAQKWVFKNQNSYIYQEFGNMKADEDFLSLNFLFYNSGRKTYPQGLAFISTNFRREIDLRYLLGVGITHQLLKKEKNWLKISLSSEYEHTSFGNSNFNLDNYDGSDVISTFRGTVWLGGRYGLFDDNLILNHEVYFQPSLEQLDNYRWSADLSLEIPLWRFLNFKINYRNTYESVVIQNQSQEDKIFSFGLTVKNFK